MKTLQLIKKVVYCTLLGVFAFACNTPSNHEAKDKEVVTEDNASSEDADKNGE